MRNKNSLCVLIVSLSSMCLVGCASITTGTTQSIFVKTGRVKNAACSLENNKGKWYIKNTPGSVKINRSFHDLSIDCEKRGFNESHMTVASNTKAAAFGNILLDAVYDYPAEVDVPMKKVSG